MGDRRRQPRAAIELQCTLQRRTGSAIAARTIDLGPGGMCVTCERPLSPDELLEFALHEARGACRVLREQAYRVYALRFERLPAPAAAQLEQLASGAA